MQLQARQTAGVRPGRVATASRPKTTAVRATAPRQFAGARIQPAHRCVQVAAATDVNSQMRANEARWANQVRDGKVRNVNAAEVSSMLEEGWVLLDVRPPDEVEKVGIPPAITIPLFSADTSLDPGSLLKQASAFGMGGWWLGGTHMLPNKNFLAEVSAQIPKDAKVIVGCQKGLRSLAACEQLSRAGYQSLAWVNGGFDTARKGDLPTTGDKDIRYAGIGGVSSLIGWTEVQQEEKGTTVLGGATGAIKVVAAILVADLMLFAWEYLQYLQGGQ